MGSLSAGDRAIAGIISLAVLEKSQAGDMDTGLLHEQLYSPWMEPHLFFPGANTVRTLRLQEMGWLQAGVSELGACFWHVPCN